MKDMILQKIIVKIKMFWMLHHEADIEVLPYLM